MDGFFEYLTSGFVVRALVAVVLIGINAALSGTFASFRSLTFLVAGASHAALAGAALTIVAGVYGGFAAISPVVGGAVFAVGLALMAGAATMRGSDRAADPAVGVGFGLSMALAVLLISLIPESATRVWGILMGDLLLLTWEDLWLLGALTAVVVVMFALFQKQFLFVTFDTQGARAFGIHAAAYNHLLFALIGLSAAIMMKGVGAIVVFAMLVSPGAAAMLLGTSVRRVMVYAFCIAVISGLVGIVLSYFIDFSVSGLAAMLAASSYFVAKLIVSVRDNGGR